MVARWNPKGYFVVYSSECLPLATLEALVHTRRRPNDQVYVELSFEDALVKEVEALYSLPADWKQDNPTTQQIGARWVDGWFVRGIIGSVRGSLHRQKLSAQPQASRISFYPMLRHNGLQF